MINKKNQEKPRCKKNQNKHEKRKQQKNQEKLRNLEKTGEKKKI